MGCLRLGYCSVHFFWLGYEYIFFGGLIWWAWALRFKSLVSLIALAVTVRQKKETKNAEYSNNSSDSGRWIRAQEQTKKKKKLTGKGGGNNSNERGRPSL